MEIMIQSIHFDADRGLLDHVNKKVEKLNTYFDKIIDAEVFLRLDNPSGAIQDKIVEIKLNLPGAVLFSKEVSKTFEDSIDQAVDSVKKQLLKHKEKIKE